MLNDQDKTDRWRQVLLAVPVPAAVIITDLVVRGHIIISLNNDFIAYYISSILSIIFVWYAILSLVKRTTQFNRAFGLALTLAIATFYCCIVLASLAFFHHFGILPNVFALDYLFQEPHDSWIYIKSGLSYGIGAIVLVLSCSLAAYLYTLSNKKAIAVSRRDLATNSFIIGLLCLFFHNNVRMGPNAFTPDVHTIFSFSKALANATLGGENVMVVGAGARRPVNADLGLLPHNVLLILNESIRASSQQAFGYQKPNTPNLQKFFSERADRIVRFDHAYANSTKTMMAFPSFFTGVVPSQSGALMHNSPLIYDYARAFRDPVTFLISSQSMHWGNFDKFLDLGKLDFAWYEELSAHRDDNVGKFESLDDKYVPQVFADFLKNMDRGKKFFGVIQLTGTHTPYLFDKFSDIFHDPGLTNDYDNSIHYHDRNFGSVLKILEKEGVLSNTLIISTSDHGEAFGEHGYFGHINTFYDEEARVPFWVHLPDNLMNHPRIVDQLRKNAQSFVSNADVLPTALSLTSGTKFNLISASMRALTGSALDQPLPKNRAIYMQNFNDIDAKTMFVGFGMIVDHYKYLLKFNQSKGEEELYDLSTDPKEESNIWPTTTPDLKKLVVNLIRQQRNSNDLYRKAMPEAGATR